MKISLIAALAENRVIGRQNDLPWNLPDDMKYFTRVTRGHVVIMGRKNYDSIPPKYRPLSNRTNVVVTRQTGFVAPGCVVVPSLEAGLSFAESQGESEVMIIGGAAIYALALPLADKLYLTEIHGSPEGDVVFPQFDRAVWKEVSRESHPADDRHRWAFDFVVYEKHPA